MKRQYFLVTFLLAIGLFLAVYLPMEILFTIFEAGPYLRLTLIVILLIADEIAVSYIVNKKLQSRWIREAPPLLDTIQAPEPEYIMDEETARRIEETRRIQTVRKNNSFLSRLYRSLSPSDDAEDELRNPPEQTVPKSDLSAAGTKPSRMDPRPDRMNRKPVPSDPKADAKLDVQKKHHTQAKHRRSGSDESRPAEQNRTQPQREAVNAAASASAGSSWQTPVEDMKTADYEDVVKALKDAGETVEPIRETRTADPASRTVPSRRRRRQQREAAAKQSAESRNSRSDTFDSIVNPKSNGRQTTEGKNDSKTASDSERKPKKRTAAAKTGANRRPSDRKRNPEKRLASENGSARRSVDASRRKQRRRSQPDRKTEAKPASNWSTPFEEQKTEELETAVEKALRQGYNPISNERNK